VGVPAITQSGFLWRNRIGAAILIRAGFEVCARWGREGALLRPNPTRCPLLPCGCVPQDLVTHSEEAYIATATRLLADPAQLATMRARVAGADLGPLHSPVEADAYVPLFRWLAHSDQVRRAPQRAGRALACRRLCDVSPLHAPRRLAKHGPAPFACFQFPSLIGATRWTEEELKECKRADKARRLELLGTGATIRQVVCSVCAVPLLLALIPSLYRYAL
jgi:hypothetical protein